MSSTFILNTNSSSFTNNTFLLIFLLICNTAYSQLNDTNDTAATTTTAAGTTNFFTTTLEPTSSTEGPSRGPTGTFSPTLEPTSSPSSNPTTKPSPSPTIEAAVDGQTFNREVPVICRGPTATVRWAQNNKDYLISNFIAALGLSEAERQKIRVIIGKIIEILGSTTRRRMADEDGGVEIQYLVSIEDARTLNAFKETIGSGEFNDKYEETITNDFDGITVDEVTEDDIIDRGTGDPDVFLLEEEATFGEIISSPYILLGIVNTIVGIIWLLFLRSTIENKYPSYLTQPNIGGGGGGGSGGNAVEMVPQTSGAADGAKQKNKQELQQAWNDSDAEVN